MRGLAEHEERHGAGQVDEARPDETEQAERAEDGEQRRDHAHVGERHVTAVRARAPAAAPSGDGGQRQHRDDRDRDELRVVADVVARLDLRRSVAQFSSAVCHTLLARIQ